MGLSIVEGSFMWFARALWGVTTRHTHTYGRKRLPESPMHPDGCSFVAQALVAPASAQASVSVAGPPGEEPWALRDRSRLFFLLFYRLFKDFSADPRFQDSYSR